MSLLDRVFQWLWRNRALDALIKRPLLARLPPGALLRLALLTGSALDEDLALLPALCGGVAVAVDVGAHYGLYTYYLARHAREVWAFEPLPRFSATLARAFPRVHVESVALSECAGSCEIRVPVYNPTMATIEQGNSLPYAEASSEIERHIVPVKTLDEYALADVGFIKIDVEGHELGVLHGARCTIEAGRPALLIELVERVRPGVIREAADWLGALGYQGYYLRDGKLHTLAGFDPAALQPDGALSSYGRRGLFINNFHFLLPSHMNKVTRWRH